MLASITASRRWLEGEWAYRFPDRKLSVVFDVSADAEVQSAIDKRPNPGEPAPYPMVSLVLASMEERVSSYNPWLTRFVGLRAGRLSKGNQAVIEKVKPVDIGLGVRFSDRSQRGVLDFASMWVECQPKVRVDIKNKHTGAIFSIPISIGGSFNFPPPSPGEGGGLFMAETSMICETYTGDTHIQNVIRSIGVSFLDNDSKEVFDQDYLIVNYQTGATRAISLP